MENCVKAETVLFFFPWSSSEKKVEDNKRMISCVFKCIKSNNKQKRQRDFGKQKFKLNKPNKCWWRWFHRWCCFTRFSFFVFFTTSRNMKNTFTPLAQRAHLGNVIYAMRCFREIGKISISIFERKKFARKRSFHDQLLIVALVVWKSSRLW